MSGVPVASTGHLEFVMFYAFRARDPDTEAQISLLARSIAGSYPEARIVLLTNAEGGGAELTADVQVHVVEAPSPFVMVERLRAYRDWAKASAPGSVLVFMDTDMLVLRRFDELTSPGADLAVSVRRDRSWPINAGLIVARMENRAGVEAFFERLAACCEGLPENDRLWYGDQIALATVLRPIPGRFRTLYTESRDGLTVRFAPSRAFNQTPRPWMMRLGLYRGSARILHFKGGRKDRMRFYARIYLSAAFRAYARLRFGG